MDHYEDNSDWLAPIRPTRTTAWDAPDSTRRTKWEIENGVEL